MCPPTCRNDACGHVLPTELSATRLWRPGVEARGQAPVVRIHVAMEPHPASPSACCQRQALPTGGARAQCGLRE